MIRSVSQYYVMNYFYQIREPKPEDFAAFILANHHFFPKPDSPGIEEISAAQLIREYVPGGLSSASDEYEAVLKILTNLLQSGNWKTFIRFSIVP